MKAFFPNFTFAYIDAEFTPDDHTIGGLVSLALHSQRGSVYMVHRWADQGVFCSNSFRRHEIWNRHLPLLPDGSLDPDGANVMSYAEMACTVDNYFRELTGGQDYRKHVGVLADHATQDMQRIHDLFDNDWQEMPSWIPRRPFLDLATLEDLAGVRVDRLPNGLPLPENPPARIHHALHDAQWHHEVHDFLLKHSKAVRVASGVERLDD